MSREEAIEILKGKIYPYNYKKNKMIISNVSEENEALKMAISALEQEPLVSQEKSTFSQGLVKPCDDAISREAVNTLVDELARAISDERCCISQRGRSTGNIMHDILELPSVTPSRRKGHWIKEVDFGNCVHYVCSECNNEGEKDYCPNCGAEMESEE